MIDALKDNLKCTKEEDLQKTASQLYILYSLKTKIKNCLTPDLARDIETSMPTEISNKDGHIFLSILSHRPIPDKEVHKRIIYEYILKLKITESNNMEAFQRELSHHIKQYDAIQGNEWKKINNCIISQYRNINEPTFQTGFNIIIIAGPKQQTKCAFLCTLLEWKIITRHDLISCNLWPDQK
jgi:hypothetical protein